MTFLIKNINENCVKFHLINYMKVLLVENIKELHSNVRLLHLINWLSLNETIKNFQ